MLRLVTSPNEIKIYKDIKLFLAGGIVNCPDWQSIIIEKLFDDSESGKYDYLCNLIVYNPRRKEFHDIKEEIEQQITWEYNKLKKSDIIAFWFSKGSLNPVVLYELGRWGNSTDKKIIVGIDDGYERKIDVEIQTKLSRPETKIVYSLNEFYYNILLEIKKINL